MNHVDIWENGKWEEVPNGPFPIESDAFNAVRELWKKEVEANPGPLGAALAPQTWARDCLKQHAPHLSSFDIMCIGYAITSKTVRVRDE